MVTDHLSPSRLRSQGIFEPAAVERLVTDHLSSNLDRGHELWLRLQLRLWHERWVARAGADATLGTVMADPA